ncbi:MAG: TetR/AcrR family transcriptional regulator [Clostridiaceae bacterium]|nr:TetR/AcrR family transcriptional regulator [Clostridiaceae bacterium]
MSFETFEKQSADKRNRIIAAGLAEFSIRSYLDANTDVITKSCGISKGLLYHYFGSKKEFYLYCLSRSLDRLTQKQDPQQGDFYEILFGIMDRKLKLCAEYPAETRFVNMASRETALEIAEGVKAFFGKYAMKMLEASASAMERALLTLPLKTDSNLAREGLLLYTNAVISKYLLAYQESPEEFFKNADEIKSKIKEYIDLMLFGVIKGSLK